MRQRWPQDLPRRRGRRRRLRETLPLQAVGRRARRAVAPRGRRRAVVLGRRPHRLLCGNHTLRYGAGDTRAASRRARARAEMSERRKQLKHDSARGVAWNLAQNLIARLLALVVVAILGRLIDKSAFGVIALALVVNSFAELVINQGFGEFITQSQSLDDEHLDTAFWLNMLVGI